MGHYAAWNCMALKIAVLNYLLVLRITVLVSPLLRR